MQSVNKLGSCLSCMLLISMIGCTVDDYQLNEVPESVTAMDNINVYKWDELAVTDTVKLVRDEVYGDTEDVFIGTIIGFNVDRNGRVYVNDGTLDARTIHVYEPDGTYIKKLGRHGNGPGEFLAPGGLKFSSDEVYVFDYNQSRLSSYTIESLNLLDTYFFDPNTIEREEEITDKRFTDYHLVSDDSLIIALKRPQSYFDESPGRYHYYLTDQNFREVGKEVLTQEAIVETWGEFRGMRIMKMFPFFEKPILHVSDRGRIFAAESGVFFIKEYSIGGSVIGGFYYQVAKKSVTRDDAIKATDEMTNDIAKNVDLPDTWPVITSMFTDDEENIWVSTFSENDNQMIWWIITPAGDLIARFRLGGDRYSEVDISGHNKHVVRNNYFYDIETDEETGLQQVVRYKLEFY